MAACWEVELITQTTAKMCWEACARMMWQWKNRAKSKADRDAEYRRAAGDYATANRGLSPSEMDTFFRQLGMRSTRGPTGPVLRQLLGRGPVTFIGGKSGYVHAMLAVCFSSREQTYTVMNPCSEESVTFDENGNDEATCTASSKRPLPVRAVDRELGAYVWYWQ